MTIIDGAPRVNELGRAAILASDLVLIPVQPSPYDICQYIVYERELQGVVNICFQNRTGRHAWTY